MKRFLFGTLLTIIGLSYSLFCFMWAVKEPWHYRGIDGMIGSLLSHELLVPFAIFNLLGLLGLSICFLEAYHKK